jgi:hypothetical protein
MCVCSTGVLGTCAHASSERARSGNRHMRQPCHNNVACRGCVSVPRQCVSPCVCQSSGVDLASRSQRTHHMGRRRPCPGAGLCTYAHRDPAIPAAPKLVKSAWGCAKEAGVWLNIRFSTFDVVKCMCILAVATATDGRGSHQAARGAGLAVTSQALLVRCVRVAWS